jgi:NADH-quinone oxidoreductase subunit L
VALCLGLGLGALAGLPPLSGFASKESVLTAAEDAALQGAGVAPGWVGALVLVAGLVTTVLTGAYAARAFVVVVLRPDRFGPHRSGPHRSGTDRFEDAPDDDAPVLPVAGAVPVHRAVPAAMAIPVAALAVPTVALSALPLLGGAAIEGAHLSLTTALLGTVLALTGVLVGWSGGGLEDRDVAGRLPRRLRQVALAGYGMDRFQAWLVVRPVRRLARLVAAGDEVVVDGYVRGSALGASALGRTLRLAQTGAVPAYLSWALGAAVALGVLALAVVGPVT